MLMLGCKPQGRHTEQHDIFFGIANTLRELIPDIEAFWPEAVGNIHIDAWREVNHVNGYRVQVDPRKEAQPAQQQEGSPRLFFMNLGGYKENEFDEFHYRMLVAAPEKGAAIRFAKATAFYQHTGFKGAESHIDDKYGVDVDDLYQIEEILPASTKDKYIISLHPQEDVTTNDPIQMGYFRLNKL
ncbi:hypothetical protein CK934_17620 [Chitinophaga sp. MD30]|nr:hypothetical protein CK934_17620 [Chitinophaga sp. MD30]